MTTQKELEKLENQKQVNRAWIQFMRDSAEYLQIRDRNEKRMAEGMSRLSVQSDGLPF